MDYYIESYEAKLDGADFLLFGGFEGVDSGENYLIFGGCCFTEPHDDLPVGYPITIEGKQYETAVPIKYSPTLQAEGYTEIENRFIFKEI